MLASLLLTACTDSTRESGAPPGDSASETEDTGVDSATDTAEDTAADPDTGTAADPSLANCTVRMDRLFTSGSETYIVEYDGESRQVAYVDSVEYADGGISGSEGSYGFDEVGCTILGWVRFVNIDGGTLATNTSDTTTEAICDAQVNPVHQEIVTETYANDGGGNTAESTDEYGLSIGNSYDADLLTAAMFARDDTGEAWRYAYEYDANANLVVRNYYANVADSAPTWTTTYTYNSDGSVQMSVFEYIDSGTSTTLDYTYDSLGRSKSLRFRIATGGVQSYTSMTTYGYTDDVWLWPATHENDVDEDRDVDETALYTYDCP